MKNVGHVAQERAHLRARRGRLLPRRLRDRLRRRWQRPRRRLRLPARCRHPARDRGGAVLVVLDHPRSRAPISSRSCSRASRSRSSGARWRERTKLWVYFAFGVVFVLVYSVVSHWIWHPDGWLFALGMQDFAGSTVVHYQGALAALAGVLLLGPRLGKYGADGDRTRSRLQHGLHDARRPHPLVRLVRLQRRPDARDPERRQARLLRLRRADDERRRGGGRPRRDPDRGSSCGSPTFDAPERRRRRARGGHGCLRLRRPAGRRS